jgi:hypothetical protein
VFLAEAHSGSGFDRAAPRYLAQLDTADLQQPSEELAAKTAHLS